MSYAMTSALQTAIFEALTNSAELGGLIGTAIYDAVPSGPTTETFVRLGTETARDASDTTGTGAVHQIDVSVVTTQPGFAIAKAAAAVISDILHNADLSLQRGRLILLHFDRARARSIDAASARQIDLRFTARVQDDD